MYKENQFHISELIEIVKHSYKGKSGIIYCATESDSHVLHSALQANIVQSIVYHSPMTDYEKSCLHWVNDKGVIILHL